MAAREMKAFEILARENSRMLTVYLRTLLDDEAAVDDLFQETMVVAWRRLDECDLSLPFGPWLRGIASRLVMAHYRKRNSQPAFMDDAVLSQVNRQFEAIGSQTADTWDEKVAALHDCLEALPENHRDVVRGRYLDEQPTRMVAEQFAADSWDQESQCRTRITASGDLVRRGNANGSSNVVGWLAESQRWTEKCDARIGRTT